MSPCKHCAFARNQGILLIVKQTKKYQFCNLCRKEIREAHLFGHGVLQWRRLGQVAEEEAHNFTRKCAVLYSAIGEWFALHEAKQHYSSRLEATKLVADVEHKRMQ